MFEPFLGSTPLSLIPPVFLAKSASKMEKLTEYLQSLLSSCSDELRLEPDKNPYLVSENSTKSVGNTPLMGTQISTMIFPLIPPDVKSVLPNKSEVEFVHSHNLGNFSFTVQKSPAGFNVTIRPIINDSSGSIPVAHSLPTVAPSISNNLGSPVITENTAPAMPQSRPEPETLPLTSNALESSAAGYDLNATEAFETATVSDLIVEKPAEFLPVDADPKVEVVAVNDPAFQTVFSDSSTYEPPAGRDDFDLGEYVPLESSKATILENSNPKIAPQAFVQQETITEPAPAYEPPPAPASEPPSVPLIHPPTDRRKQTAFVPAPVNAAETAKMDALFNKMAELGASDLHLTVSMPPLIRKDGKMQPLETGAAALTPDSMRALLTSIMPARNQEEFARRNDTDFAYEIPGLARFRCNIFMDRKGMGGVFRIIPAKMTTAAQIGLSEAILSLCKLSKGLVVVTGPTGSGKSTTLCAMVNEINLTREEHIITIEDPIEFVHENHKCLVNQREVHNHTDSFKDALRAALREDPDIVLVGEMRDLETIAIAIETAETGHLVFGTLHTTTAASTVDRIIDQFPADRQQQIRVMLSESLKGVIAQTLLPKKGGGRVAAHEVLIVTPAISNLIREGKTFQISSAIQTGKSLGMVMLNDALYAHVESGAVEPIDAYLRAVDKTGFEALLQRGGFSI